MYRIAVCDDEPVMAEENAILVREAMEHRSMRCFIDYTLDVFTSPDPIIEKLKADSHAYHLLLLDIKLDSSDGVELAAFLRSERISCSIIYITAYRELAIRTFPTYPLEFLTKPVDRERLGAAINWDLRENFRPERPLLQTETRPVYLKDILYLEISGRKVAIHTREDTLFSAESLTEIESRISRYGFGRSHFSYLVNFAFIHSIGKTEVILLGGQTVPVSRRFQKDLITAHIEWMKQ